METKTEGTTTTATGTVTGSADSSGKTAVRVDDDAADALIAAAKEAETAGNAAVVEIRLETDNAATATEITIPKNSFSDLATDTDAALTINTGIGRVTFDSAAVDSINAVSSSDVKISVARIDASALTDVQKMQIGDRPVYDFTVTSGDTIISDFEGGTVNIQIPYNPAAGDDENAVVVYYLSDAGELETVRGKYNPETGMVEFSTKHFSKYVVGYNKVSFDDVASTDWFENAVTFIAARGITTGTGGGAFSPGATLTRGQFIVSLMRAYGIDPDLNPTDNFSDAGDTYYTDYLAAAKQLGISSGTGGNKFAPDSALTRQDMFTLLYRTLVILGELPEVRTGQTTDDFIDADKIADYAQSAMNALVQAEIITGSDGKLNPSDTTTRAEMAQVLYSLLEK